MFNSSWRYGKPFATSIPFRGSNRVIHIHMVVREHINAVTCTVDRQEYGETTIRMGGFTDDERKEFLELWVRRREPDAMVKLNAFMHRFNGEPKNV